jgi:acyl-CoA thioester hydrolase
VFELHFRVDYIDTDAMGVAHHSSYCRWLERARVDWLASLGVSYAKMEAEGYALPVRRLELEYFKPLRFDDRAVISLRLARMDRVRMNIEYEIWKTRGRTLGDLSEHEGQSENQGQSEKNQGDKILDKILVSRAITELVLVKNLKPASIPEEWRKKWQQPSVVKS